MVQLTGSSVGLVCAGCVRVAACRVHSCQYQGLVGSKGSECCSVFMRMVGDCTDETMQRQLCIHVHKLP